MPVKKIFLSLIILSALFKSAVYAEQSTLKPFTSGSYQQILADNTNQPFMLVVWSLTCTSCLKDMELLSAIHKNRPEFKIIMLATDDIAETAQIQSILEKYQLSGIENWVYADENTQKLQYEIDPKWYGEQPRTYFFNRDHQREGVSGALSKEEFDKRLAKILS
jgi:thiol-disulfide isomerase/thioredoxin